MWDWPTGGHERRRLLGTAVVWRWAVPAVRADLLALAKEEAPVVETLAMSVEAGQGAERYPFSALLYQSTMYERYKTAHFGRLDVPTRMSELGGEGGDHGITRQVVLWNSRYLSQ